ncbi:MAG: glycosyltransferase [Acidimicrobiales bacterium]|nr:glycosyltransferase [Acidimicrobiales bacterium]RZV48655.1 MAG: glycosyltransferase [Acidimicrobiales bacterium]
MNRRLRLFVAVALIATAVDLFGYLALREWFAWWAADIAALVAAAVVGISLHRRLTLRGDPNLRWIHRPAAIFFSPVIAGAADLLVLSTSTDKALVAKLFAIGAGALIRLLTNRFLLFRMINGEQSEPAGRPAPNDALRLSVVLPAYKEVEAIASTVEVVHEHLAHIMDPADFEIVVVDDGSGDGTADAAEATGLARAILLPQNRGKGGAVREGMLQSRGRSRVFLDADLAYGPDEIIRLMVELEKGWDVVVGSRHDSRMVSRSSAGLLRDVGGRLVNMATHLLLLGQYLDTQAGCKGFRSDVAMLVFTKSRLTGFSFDIEIFHLVERYRLSLKEIPMTVASTDSSTVSLIADTRRLLVDLLRIRRWSARGVYSRQPDDPQLPEPVQTSANDMNGSPTRG